jgi:hypothetical protein
MEPQILREPYFWAPDVPWGRWEFAHIFAICADFRAFQQAFQ